MSSAGLVRTWPSRACQALPITASPYQAILPKGIRAMQKVTTGELVFAACFAGPVIGHVKRRKIRREVLAPFVHMACKSFSHLPTRRSLSRQGPEMPWGETPGLGGTGFCAGLVDPVRRRLVSELYLERWAAERGPARPTGGRNRGSRAWRSRSWAAPESTP